MEENINNGFQKYIDQSSDDFKKRVDEYDMEIKLNNSLNESLSQRQFRNDNLDLKNVSLIKGEHIS